MLRPDSNLLISIVLLTLLTGCLASSSSQVAPLPTIAATPPSALENSQPPPLPPLPNVLPTPRYHKELDWLEKKATKSILQDTKLSLGVGQLRPTDLSTYTPAEWETNPLIGSGWLGKVRLPLYNRPGGTLQGWLANGWVLRQTDSSVKIFQPDKRPFTVESIVYKGTVNSLIVLDTTKDGWFRFRYAEPNSTNDGTAWAHTSHFKLSNIALTVEPWEKWFTKQRLLYVRGDSYPIYKQATANSQVITRLGEPGTANQKQLYTLETIAFKGDWVKIKIKVPAEYCATSPNNAMSSRIYEGWLKWRTPQQGSRLWYYSSC